MSALLQHSIYSSFLSKYLQINGPQLRWPYMNTAWCWDLPLVKLYLSSLLSSPCNFCIGRLSLQGRGQVGIDSQLLWVVMLGTCWEGWHYITPMEFQVLPIPYHLILTIHNSLLYSLTLSLSVYPCVPLGIMTVWLVTALLNLFCRQWGVGDTWTPSHSLLKVLSGICQSLKCPDSYLPCWALLVKYS